MIAVSRPPPPNSVTAELKRTIFTWSRLPAIQRSDLHPGALGGMSCQLFILFSKIHVFPISSPQLFFFWFFFLAGVEICPLFIPLPIFFHFAFPPAFTCLSTVVPYHQSPSSSFLCTNTAFSGKHQDRPCYSDKAISYVAIQVAQPLLDFLDYPQYDNRSRGPIALAPLFHNFT